MLMVSFSQAFLFSLLNIIQIFTISQIVSPGFESIWNHSKHWRMFENILQNSENFHYFSAMSNLLNLQLCQYWDNIYLTSMAMANVMKNRNLLQNKKSWDDPQFYLSIFCHISHLERCLISLRGALWKLWNVDFCSCISASVEREREWLKCIIWFGHQQKWVERSKSNFAISN